MTLAKSTGTAAKTKVLLVDDDDRLLAALKRGLSIRGFDVGVARDAGEALSFLQAPWPDLVVLDIMMPVMDGLTFCPLIRQRADVPILMLTARDSIADRVAGLGAGADDYLVKPFDLEELVARLHALLRRRPAPAAPTRVLHCGDLELDHRLWQAKRANRKLLLTATEFRLLECLMQRSGETVRRQDLVEMIWGPEQAGVASNVLDVHVANLRQKLEEGGRSRILHTVRSVGYVLRSDPCL